MKYKSVVFIISLVLLLCACNKNKIFHRFTDIPGNTWHSKNLINFNVPIADTVSSHNVYLLIRNNANYKYSNIYLFVTITSPAGFSVRDTVELTLADKNGRWLGRGAADLYTSRHPYKMNIRFPYRGIYTFDIEQALWETELKNISSVGLQIEKLQ
jgi:gliding motility-associated lipoprotein GldH